MRAAVIGAGSWGTALAHVLSKNGHQVTLWGRNEDVVRRINESHENPRYLKQALLHVALRATTDFQEATEKAELVILSVPSSGIRDVLERECHAISRTAVIAHAIKGFVRPDNLRVSECIASILPVEKRIAVISGPSHAEEVVLDMPTTVVVASTSKTTAEFVQDALMNNHLRVYTQADMVGVELGGTLKNIIALGVGLIAGLGLGDNTKAALMTRGLAEMTRLGMALGASPMTFSGLAGVGDLIVTCTSVHSRNYRMGKLLATGMSLDQALKDIGMAVEGVGTTFAASELALTHGVDMPITNAIEMVLRGDVTPMDAVSRLMRRDRNHEMEDIGAQPIAMDWKQP